MLSGKKAIEPTFVFYLWLNTPEYGSEEKSCLSVSSALLTHDCAL